MKAVESARRGLALVVCSSQRFNVAALSKGEFHLADKLWIGLDVSEQAIQACVLSTRRKPVAEFACQPTCGDLMVELDKWPREQFVAIGLESGASPALARELKRTGLPIRLLDAGKASRFLAVRVIKSDRNDAHGLAELVRLEDGSHLEAHIRGEDCQHIRTILTMREQLIRQRTASRNALRSQLRNCGSQIRQITIGRQFRTRVELELFELSQSKNVAADAYVMPLLDICEAQTRYIAAVDRQIATCSEDIGAIKKFRDIPGVGPICAASFYSAIEDPARFKRSRDVGAYLGLVPKLKQSGSMISRSRISRAGDSMTRSHLFLAAGVMISRAATRCAIADWGKELAGRIGYKKAQIAVARKLSVAMISMWKADSVFDPYPSRSALRSGGREFRAEA